MFPIWLYIWLLSQTTHITVYSFTHRICNSTSNHNSCEGETITCSANQDCFIECSGSAACRDTIIHCPIAKKCHIKCHRPPNTQPTNNAFICMHMTINAAHSSQLILSASFGDLDAAPTDTQFFPRTLEDATIYCPHNGRNSGIKPCIINCDGDDLIRRPKIYAVEGFNDLYINSTAYHTDYCIRAATLYCTENFSATCQMTSTAPYGCQDYVHQITDQTCESYTIDTGAPTSASPTMPTLFPSHSPTMAPTINTDSLTVNPTISAPTFTPTTAAVMGRIPGNGEGSGLNTTGWVLVIILPVFAMLCICMGLGIFAMKKKSDPEHKHSSIEDKCFDEDEDEEEEEYDDVYDKNTVSNYESAEEESKSKESTVEIGMGVHKKGHSGIYEQCIDEDTVDEMENDVQNGDVYAGKLQSSVSDESQSEY